MKVEISDYGEADVGRIATVDISDDDIYSLDHTLSLVILPALEKFYAHYKKDGAWHGCFAVSDDDINLVNNPDLVMSAEHLKALDSPTDPLHEEAAEIYSRRYRHVFESMIAAFKAIADDGASDPWDIDTEALVAREREKSAMIKYGTTLFGKYYGGLWY